MTEDTFAAGFLDDYFAECDEHLTIVRRLLLELPDAQADRPVRPAALEELFRSFHSVKGVSGMVGAREAELLAHHLEDYLRVLRLPTLPLCALPLHDVGSLRILPHKRSWTT